MAIVKHIKSRNTNYSVDIDNMYEFASHTALISKISAMMRILLSIGVDP